jgi:putative acetyltransferase
VSVIQETPRSCRWCIGYRDAVRSIGSEAYTPEQVAAWAEYPIDIEEFRARLSRGYTLIAEEDGRMIAFGQLDPVDHIAFLYCRGADGRRGIGTAIYGALEAHALGHGVHMISVDAS